MDNTITATILESMSDGVLVIGFNGRIVFCCNRCIITRGILA
ncbi:MAG: hypothetical protein NT010_14440 [Proteobacteria bacterium]|nr:hypothetical protein [Pseudomonadota bacterium]